MESQKSDHETVAQLRGSPPAPPMDGKLSLLDQSEPRLNQQLGRHDPVEAVPGTGHEREILFDLPQPGEVPLRRKDLGHAPQLVGGLGLRDGPPDRADLRQEALDRSRRDLRARWGSQVEPTTSVEVVQKVAVSAT